MKARLAMILIIVGMTPALYADSIFSDTFQGVTFTFTQPDSDPNQLIFNLAGTPSGDWTGVQYLAAFALKNIGFDYTSGTALATGPGATNLDALDKAELSDANIFCSDVSGNKKVGCWNLNPDTPLGSLPFDFTYTINFASALNIPTTGDKIGPELKIGFTIIQNGDKIGSLYSQNVPFTSSSGTSSSGTSSSGTSSSGTSSSGTSSSGVVPEPATGALVLIGLGLIGAGFGFRRRSRG
jgi:hypothetical protein